MNGKQRNQNNCGFTLFEKLVSEKKKLISNKIILDKKDNHKYPIKVTPFKIPLNWYWCYLSDISIIQEGPGIRKHQYKNEGIQFLTVTNILEDSIDLEKSKKYISHDEYKKNYSHFTINKGDIVTACSGGSWGKSAIYDLNDKIILNTSTLRLRFYNDLANNYYLYYLTKTKYFKDSLSIYSTGQQPNYGYSHYAKIPIPLPPLQEQQRIVTILDKAFTAIAKVKANAAKNLKNSKEIFESYLQSVFENKGEGWEEKRLGDIADVEYGYTDKSNETGDYRYIRITDINNNGELISDNKKYIKQSKEAEKFLIKYNDLLMARTGATFAKVLLYKDYEKAVFASYLIRINFKEKIDNKLYWYFTKNPYYWKQANALASGAAQPHFNGVALKQVLFRFPKSLSEQQAIVAKLDALSAETKQLEANYQQKLNNLEELKKSLLQKAFNGELDTESVNMCENEKKIQYKLPTDRTEVMK